MVTKKPFLSEAALTEKYAGAFRETSEPDNRSLSHVARLIGADWHRLARALEVPDADIRQVRHQHVGTEAVTILRIWMFLKKEQSTRKFFFQKQKELKERIYWSIRISKRNSEYQNCSIFCNIW